MNGLDLFSGIGGIGIALAPWVHTVAYCEIERYPTAVLLSLMERGDIPPAPIWDDVRTLTHADLPNIDIIFGGFPCQDISCAGRGEGLEGKRSGLFFEIVRLARELKPTFIFLENVPAIATRGGVAVVKSLTDAGYDCRWTTLSAADVGANHRRNRFWLLAYSDCPRRGLQQISRDEIKTTPYSNNNGSKESLANSTRERTGGLSARSRNQGEGKTDTDWRREDVADTSSLGLQASERNTGRTYTGNCSERKPGHSVDSWSRGWWATEPDVGRVAHGLPLRAHRIKSLGNAVVPLCAREAFKELMFGGAA